MGALGDNGLNLPLGLQEAFEHHETHEDHPEGASSQGSAPQMRDFKPETLKAEQNPPPVLSFPNIGASFLEEVYTGEPLMVARIWVSSNAARWVSTSQNAMQSQTLAHAHIGLSRVLSPMNAAAPMRGGGTTCQSERPWEADEHAFCCPAACTDNYAKARLSADTDLEAFTSTFFTNPTCFPEALELLNSEPLP